MKLKSRSSNFLSFFKNGTKKNMPMSESEHPLRDELYNSDQLEQFGEKLATVHCMAPFSASDILLERLNNNEHTLKKIYRRLTSHSPKKSRITPAMEWLLDNFYLVEEQIQITKTHLPKGYGRSLPALINGLFPGCPRVYDLTLRMIAHGDGRWDAESLSRSLAAYQHTNILTLGELWAIPIMLRLGLIENLRRIGARIMTNYTERSTADHWANQMKKVAEQDPKSLILVIADMARSNPPLTSAFVANMTRRLKGQGTLLALPLTWIEQQLFETGSTIEQMIQAENQQQVADQVSISNSIASLRRLGEVDWREFVEGLSAVNALLQTDPSDTYGRMDFATKDYYRHQIETLARSSDTPEIEVATVAIELAKAAQTSHTAPGVKEVCMHHVGYYLIDAGRAELEKKLALRCSSWHKIKKFFAKKALATYLGLIALITLGFSVFTGLGIKSTSLETAWIILFIFALLCAGSQLAIELVNWFATLTVKPKSLPRLDFKTGIPPEWRTLVVVPAMLTQRQSIETLVEALEVRFLGNRDPHLHFALVTDFNDAATEHLPEDEALVDFAAEQITLLNQRFSTQQGSVFFLLHRPRRWNPREKVWMGYERKRGKLGDVNALLQGKNSAQFSRIVGDIEVLTNVKFVITLDSDTQLPRDAARQMVGTMAHPLNRPYYDETKQTVVRGYGILQPRVAEAFTRYGMNKYVSLQGIEPGVDPYTRIVSDVYQDIFQEGSFLGKGIYDVHLFEQILGNHFPENCILSHDLLEGCYLRSGLLSDILVYEQSPDTYITDTKRRARWIRGDWQLLPWLLPEIRTQKNRSERNPLSPLSRWKLFDNLRRSLVPTSLLILFIFGLTIMHFKTFWIGFGALFALPIMLSVLWQSMHKPKEISYKQHADDLNKTINMRIDQFMLQITTLPYEINYSVRAIILTLWRMIVSRRHLLQWVPSDQAGRNFRNTLTAWIITLKTGPLLTIIFAVSLFATDHRGALLVSLPILGLWLFSPFIMAWLSKPFLKAPPKLTTQQTLLLTTTARKTWAFFETFVVAADNWLPPDNYQEEPVVAIAHRTSPTNIGLALLANLTAYDFGYLTLDEVLERTQNTLHTLEQLERYRGHFYNWYDTLTLQPLAPRYVSAVDSGNLAGHLLTLRQGLLLLVNDPLLSTKSLDGLTDTLNVLVETTGTLHFEVLQQFRRLLHSAYAAFTNWSSALISADALCAAALKIQTIFQGQPTESIKTWSEKLYSHCLAMRQQLNVFADEENLTLLPADLTLSQISNTEEAALHNVRKQAQNYVRTLNRLAELTQSFSNMNIDFLYDSVTHLVSIGYNVDQQQRDRGCYDLLSSEARLAIFVAIAQGQIPQESWFALGRRLVSSSDKPILMSWSGSMFEYLMPMLVMPSYQNTLLDQTCHAAVTRQIQYGRQRKVPWGISESGYNAIDAEQNYQYRAFGVPGLGLKAGLAEELVIAPYATLMALMVAPEEACLNLERLVSEGAMGQYGFFEALDYTPSRLPRGSEFVRVSSFMVHHQGMAFLALSYLLHQKPMQKRFEADPLFQAALLLLQERAPRALTSYFQTSQSAASIPTSAKTNNLLRVFENPNTLSPEVQLLSNGHYHVMITQAGGGYSRWKNFALTRWREDTTSDNWGVFSYIQDVETEKFWSTTYQPLAGQTNDYQAVFSEGHVEFKRKIAHLECYTEIVVSPEDNIEVRRLRIQNRSKVRRVIEFTSYAEIVLNTQAADQAHPAFSKLFVETEILKSHDAVIATRRPRGDNEEIPWMFHLLNGVQHEGGAEISFETDRSRFIGRGRNSASPLALVNSGPLSDTEGAVIDPIIAIRYRLTLEPGSIVKLDLVAGVSDSRAACLGLIEKYRDRKMTNRVFGLAWTHSQVLLRQLNISETDAEIYAQLASHIVYANHGFRAEATILASNRRGQSALWPYSISGDLPIIVLLIESADNIALVKQLIQAHAYWSQKGLAVDLVILNEERSNYRQVLHDKILGLLTAAHVIDSQGHIFLHATEHMPFEDRILLQAVARIVLSDKRGTLIEQLEQRYRNAALPAHLPIRAMPNSDSTQTLPPLPPLQFFNDIGGFTESGTEYILRLNSARPTPAPWCNILANPNFGTVLSESGQAYTWIDNAHQFRLSPWNNDALQDTSGEALYLRDEDSGHCWSPTLLPGLGRGEYETRHGFGYSVFSHIEAGIHTELWVYVAPDAAVKFSVLKIKNKSEHTRRLAATGYVEWVLGDLASKTNMHVVTEMTDTGTMLAHNRYNTEWGERTAFFDAVTPLFESVTRTFTGDRTEFLGRNNIPQKPLALKRLGLSGRIGAGLDPCGAVQLAFDLAADQSREIIFVLGAGQTEQDARELAKKYCSGMSGITAAHEALETTHQYWQHALGQIKVETPDPALNFLANGWLMYQTISSRIWARSGYYQSGGAFGFRDQLQDAMALAHTKPEYLRAQILRSAAQQFVEGDVQHWWHPPQNRGVRTRCSDDYLWLPYAMCRYIEVTGDLGILDEPCPYIQGRLLNPGEESYYDLPTRTEKSFSLYQHGRQAILNGLKFGEHGLPLIGSGDWNDGMNLVGEHGKGESIWLGFFLYDTLQQFSKLAQKYADPSFAARCDKEAVTLQANLEASGWDGQWYRRAYFDNGTVLGSHLNTECRIDSIAQSWAVLSGAGAKARTVQAIHSLNQYLVRYEDSLIQLLDPPFDKSDLNPGYIKGYVPGIRENGGQYTQSAVWAAMACAKMGENKLAWDWFELINPINHGDTFEKAQVYRVEPYVIAADVYSVAPHVGRGGWSWYTGSAAWMYRLITESLLGLNKQGDVLTINPCFPEHWQGFKVEYRYGSTLYEIQINKVTGTPRLLLDGETQAGLAFHLSDDGKTHRVDVDV